MERRQGGESGVVELQARRGEAAWGALEAGSWEAGACDPELLRACLCRSFVLKPDREGFSHTLPSARRMRELEPGPVTYCYRHADGPGVRMMLAEGLVQDITVAVRLREHRQPFSLQMDLGAGHRMQANFFHPPFPAHRDAVHDSTRFLPLARTLLTTGVVAAGVESLWRGSIRLETPHLAVRDRAPRTSQFRRT